MTIYGILKNKNNIHIKLMFYQDFYKFQKKINKSTQFPTVHTAMYNIDMTF